MAVEAAGRGIEALGGDDAVAGGLLGEMPLGVPGVGGPVDLADVALLVSCV